MTHHSYLTQLDKKALKENKIVISYDRHDGRCHIDWIK